MPVASVDVRFSNRPFRVKRFQTIHHYSVDVAHGLVLLYGIGTKALPSWDSKTRWNNLSGGLAVRRTVGPSRHANSPHPSSREGHHSTARWSFSNRPFRVKRFSDYPPLQCRCRSRARASLRNRHQGPFHHGIRGRGGTIYRAALPSDER